ncbi:MAG: N-acetylmuramoyl-L-alanine amidase [Alphaproteobacteria bacterium]|nr:N-acetylmuramoyl-L-alanine amidase [Alphaproteobacteria bacterium]
MLLWLLLLVAALPAHAARLTAVRPFSEDGHARLLLILDASAADAELTLSTRASPPLGAIAARGITTIDGLDLAEDLPDIVPVDSHGVRKLLVAQVDGGVQLTVELDDSRRVRAERVHPRGIMVDLLSEGVPDDDDRVPTREQLVAMVEGIDLVRAAGGVRKDRPVIVLDAGHGGFDHGAVGTTGTREADIALQLVLRTARRMRSDLDAEVILTRDHDEFLTLTRRATIANSADADLFLSVHANAAPRPGAWGIETYSMDTASDQGAARVASRENAIAREMAEEEVADPLAAQLITAGTMRLSKELSAHVQRGVVDRVRHVYGADQTKDLGNKTALFSVLTRTRMPAVLFESGFVSNPSDERRLRAPHYQEALAGALSDAVGRWLARQGAGEGSRPPRKGP